MKYLNLNRKRDNLLLISLFSFFSLVYASFFPAYSQKPLKIYALQVIQHPALDASRKGVYDELVQSGYKPGSDFIWSYQNAQGNVSLAAQMAQNAVGDHADALVTLGTLVTQTACAATKSVRVPIVFVSVTDPVAAKIVKSIKKPSGNATGVSNLTSSETQFRFFKTIQPNLKTIGVIYNPGEANSKALLQEMENGAKKVGIKLVLATAIKTSEVQSAAAKIAPLVDAFYVNNDNTALSAFESIVKIGLSLGKPSYVSDIDMIERGALAALGPNQYEMGRQAGKMLIRIFKGQSPADMPVEFPNKLQVVINDKIAKKVGIKINPKEIEDELKNFPPESIIYF